MENVYKITKPKLPDMHAAHFNSFSSREHGRLHYHHFFVKNAKMGRAEGLQFFKIKRLSKALNRNR